MKRPTVLIVDDSQLNREILCDILQEYHSIQASNGIEAIEILNERIKEIDLVLLDHFMPEMNGMEVLKIMNDRQWNLKVPTIMISAMNDADLIDQAYELGVFDFISRPFNLSIVQHRVENTILIFGKQKQLERLVEREVQEKGKQSDMLINVLAHIVEFRNNESGQHVVNVRKITEILMKRLIELDPHTNFTPEQVQLIALASSLHDVGKISIDEKILNKPGKLTREEREIMMEHTWIGEEMLRQVPQYQHDELMVFAKEIARSHHERYDGSGYPDHLKQDEIPITAQVVSIADVYEALTAKRVYKEPYPHEKAIQMIMDGECGTFNPLLLKCLKDQEGRLKKMIEGQEGLDVFYEGSDGLDLLMEKSDPLWIDRERNEFYMSHSHEVRFEISLRPCLLTISSFAATRFHLPKVILDPRHSTELSHLLGKENVETIASQLERTTIEHPDLELELQIGQGKDRHWWHQKIRALFSEERKKVGYVGLQFDIHEEKQRRQWLTRSAMHDSLTGLLNKRSARIRFERLLAKFPEDHFAIAILDLDHFKEANDTYGHEFGDQVLKEIAKRILKNIRSEDMAARIGGDEFMIMIHYRQNIDAIVQRIFDAIQKEPLHSFPIRLSMGVASTEHFERDFLQLFRKADEMMYLAKRNGRHQLFVDRGKE